MRAHIPVRLHRIQRATCLVTQLHIIRSAPLPVRILAQGGFSPNCTTCEARRLFASLMAVLSPAAHRTAGRPPLVPVSSPVKRQIFTRPPESAGCIPPGIRPAFVTDAAPASFQLSHIAGP